MYKELLRQRLRQMGVTNVDYFPGEKIATSEAIAKELYYALERIEAGDYELGTDDDD